MVPLAIGAFIFTFTEIAVLCTRHYISTVLCARFSVRFETQPWNSVSEAFPALYLTGYIYIFTLLRNYSNNGYA